MYTYSSLAINEFFTPGMRPSATNRRLAAPYTISVNPPNINKNSISFMRNQKMEEKIPLNHEPNLLLKDLWCSG